MPQKVILLTPPGDELAKGLFHAATCVPPLGLGYLASSVNRGRYDIKILDAVGEKMDIKKTLSFLEEERPDVAGVTFTTEKRFDGFRLIREIDRKLPQTTIIAGGAHCSLAPNDTLEGIPQIDFIVRGEGETTFPELLDAIHNGNMPKVDGISYRKNGVVINNKERALIQDLDSIAFPDYSLIDLDKYSLTLNIPGQESRRAATIIANRGCPFGCSFCATSKLWGKIFRARSVQNIISEMEFLRKKYQIDTFWILDDTFTVNIDKVRQFCTYLLEYKWNIKWYSSIRVDNMDKETLALMRDAGMVFVTYGIESGSERIIKEVIGKGITLEKGKRVTEWCKELRISSRIFFMFSFPGETKQEFEKTLTLIKELRADTTLSLLRIYPGTKIEAIAKERGILPKDFSWTKNDNELTCLRFLMGDVPVFRDKFGWFQIFRYLFLWAGSGQSYLNPFALIPCLLRDIRTPKDFYKMMLLGLAFLSVLFEKFVKKMTGEVTAGRLVCR